MPQNLLSRRHDIVKNTMPQRHSEPLRQAGFVRCENGDKGCGKTELEAPLEAADAGAAVLVFACPGAGGAG